jgi:hypothetical protein
MRPTRMFRELSEVLVDFSKRNFELLCMCSDVLCGFLVTSLGSKNQKNTHNYYS